MVREGINAKVRSQLAICANQQVSIKGCGHPGRIVVCLLQQMRRLNEVNADQQPAPGKETGRSA
jgi:hypothetical protein